ncbi:lipopolysaccharide biosynthesis protein [Devosia sp. PTR5]|uniref:Lipopolysaccharide biosynthesis protein n=1 Tax=Devosia oryzisoli TaxID=2774138 RepID=A0A927FUW2_9HYPH|nr:lipopolysaccharide biosynthesis protein [Devosia oryzisoli]MBD8065213.1 lipopolysaccharide biosynthesis protein [Devosia oryzisoli]
MTLVADTTGPKLDHVRTGRASAALKGTIWSLVSSFTPAAVGFLVFLATSRALTPAEFGIVAYAASIATIGLAISPAGFREALIQHKAIAPVHLDTVFWLSMVSGLVIYGGLCASAPFVAAQSGETLLLALIPFISARVIFDMAAAVPNALLVRTMSFRMLAFRTSLASLAAAGICLGLLWLGFGVWALAASQLAASAATCIGAMVASGWRPSLRFERAALSDLRTFGLFSTGTHFITTLSIDQLLIGITLGPAGLGIYSFGRRIFQILTDLMSGALNLVSYSLLSSMQDEKAKLRQAFLFGTFASSIIAFPAFTGLALIAPDFVPFVFGDHWVEAVPVVQAFCALGLLTAVGVLQSSLVRSQGQADIWFYYLLGKQVITVLYVWLFSGWGVEALTTAIVVQNYVMWLPTVFMVARLLGLSMAGYLASFALPIFATMLMLVAGTFIQQQLADAPTMLRLGATIGGSALVYGAAVLVLGRRRLMEIGRLVRRRGG